jgi:glycosyltransferase involved in cell wall biosynthesis
MKISDVDHKHSQRRLRVAVLSRVFSVSGGGAERYAISIAEQLAQRHDIHVFSQVVQHSLPGITYHRISCPLSKPRWLNQLWYALSVWRLTRKGFDIVHSHENVWHGNVQTLHVKTVKRSIWETATLTSALWSVVRVATSPRLMTYWALEALRISQRNHAALVAVSPSLGDELAQEYPNAAQRIRVVVPSVITPPLQMSRAQACEALNLPSHKTYILFVANDYRRKGLRTLLLACKTLADDVELLVVGNSQYKSDFQTLANTEGLAGRVHFLGALQDMQPAYRAAKVLAHPTLEDTFGMVVLEAMAHGLPVVVSGPGHCGIASMLTDGENALLLDHPEDAAQLVSQLQRCLNDDALCALLALRGLSLAEEHTWQSAANAYEKIYYSLP